ncbi:MAG: PilZ domain-containing protein [Candidatus Omnitrophota bacterium]
MWDGINRRRFPRANYPCKVKLYKKHPAEEILTQTDNVGVGGVGVTLGKELPRFLEVQLELDFEDGVGSIKSMGRIVWSVKHTIKLDKKPKFDTGIEFTNLKAEDKKRIEKIVEMVLIKNPPQEQEA